MFVFPPLQSLVPGYVIKDAVEENYGSDHDSCMIIEYPVPSLALNSKSFMKVFVLICVHARETNTHARVNLSDMSTYKTIQVMLKVISFSSLNMRVSLFSSENQAS